MRRLRIRMNRDSDGQQTGATIPPWEELKGMNAEGVRELAGKLGIEYSNRAATLSAINKAR